MNRDSMSTSKNYILEEGENFMRMRIMHNFLDWKSFVLQIPDGKEL